MTVAFNTSQRAEWFDVPTVCRILRLTREDILVLIQAGQLQARSVNGEPRISSTSLDRYTEQRPVRFSSEPQTYTKVGGKVFEELPDGKLIPVR